MDIPRSKIIKKSVILFYINNMTIWCKHVHRLELQFFTFCVEHLPVRLDIETKFPYFFIFDMVFNKWKSGMSSLSCPADTERCINVVLTMLDRLRSCNDVKPTLIQRIVSAGETPHLTRCSYTAQQDQKAVSACVKNSCLLIQWLMNMMNILFSSKH